VNEVLYRPCSNRTISEDRLVIHRPIDVKILLPQDRLSISDDCSGDLEANFSFPKAGVRPQAAAYQVTSLRPQAISLEPLSISDSLQLTIAQDLAASPASWAANPVNWTASPVSLAASPANWTASPVSLAASPASWAASSVSFAASPARWAASPGSLAASPVSWAASPGSLGRRGRWQRPPSLGLTYSGRPAVLYTPPPQPPIRRNRPT
jgi:hypothetical protein